MPAWIHDRAKHIMSKNPDMNESTAFAVATQQSHALGKSPKGYGTVKGRATAKKKYKTPEDDQKKAASVLVELHKQAFGVSSYSGPLNPVIDSGASFQPPKKAPTLQRAIQKTAELWPGFFAEMLKHANVNIGQWWEQVGGPHLAKGGDHKTFKKMMDADGIPPAVQAKFERVAKEKYPPGHTTAGHAARGGPGFSTFSPTAATAINIGGAGLMGAVGLQAALAKKRENPNTAVPEWKGRLGHAIELGVPLAGAGAFLGKGLHMLGKAKTPHAGLMGAGVGALAGAGIGQVMHHISKGEDALDASDAMEDPELRQHIRREAGRTESAQRGISLLEKALPAAMSAYQLHDMPILRSTIPAGVPLGLAALSSIGGGMQKKFHAANKHQQVQEKAAAGAPTRGNFMMASDIPPFKAPRLDRAIQKDGAFGKEKDGDMLSDYVTYNPGDFKKSKYAMSLEELSSFVSELLEKDAAIASPAAQLSKTQNVGAPKATAPPGPSIADIAKPKGAKFGIGIPGAFKTKL